MRTSRTVKKTTARKTVSRRAKAAPVEEPVRRVVIQERKLTRAGELKSLALQTMEGILLESSSERNKLEAAKTVLTLARAEEESVRIETEEAPVTTTRATFSSPAPVRVLPRRRRKGKKEEEMEIAESLVAEGKFSVPSAPGH